MYRLSIELYKREWKFGRMRNAVWKHEPQASVSTAFSSSPKLSRVFVELNRNAEYMFSILLENRATRKTKTTC